ncbi:MAG: 16S rRNA (uracil(1498)-N(3))-methyltransferase [Deltaproteobacteria bacterium]|jgi:16S rRNA (uracil1498-N3)-methyltransferase|nr:16S rRNA (uracil(1498)-N(3))-methyltransferase [Deltaproteobacteria bacterium]
MRALRLSLEGARLLGGGRAAAGAGEASGAGGGGPVVLAAGAPAPPKFTVAGAVYALSPPEARHGVTVLRLSAGDRVEVLGDLGTAPAEILESVRGRPPRLSVRLTGPFAARPPALPPTILALAALRPQAFAWAAGKASELGAAVLAALLLDRSRTRGGDSGLVLVRKALAAARESRKQCGRPLPLEVAGPATLPAFLGGLAALETGAGRLARAPEAAGTDSGKGGAATSGGCGEHPAPPPLPAVRLLADREGAPILAALERLAGGPPPEPPCLTVLVGPEGGLAPGERDAALGAGFVPVSLGPWTLRAETAAVAALAAMAAFLLAKADCARVRAAAQENPAPETRAP